MRRNSYYNKDGSARLLTDLHEYTDDYMCSFVKDTFEDYSVRICMPHNKWVEIPSKFEIAQTEGGQVDFIPVANLLPVSLLTVDGAIAINEIKDYEFSIDDKQLIEWGVPSVPCGSFLVINHGLVVNTNPEFDGIDKNI